MFRGKREEYSQDAFVATAVEALEPGKVTSSAERASEKNDENKQLLTRKKLLTLNNDKLRQQLAPIMPIRNFSSLYIGVPYLFRRIVSVLMGTKSVGASCANNWELRHYAQLGTLEEPLINVWLSPLMVKQSQNYRLGTEDVYLISLGKRVFRPCRREYQDFVIVPGNEFVF